MTSQQTNKKIKEILSKYLENDKAIEMLKELNAVEGNKSFKDSMANLLKIFVTKP